MPNLKQKATTNFKIRLGQFWRKAKPMSPGFKICHLHYRWLQCKLWGSVQSTCRVYPPWQDSYRCSPFDLFSVLPQIKEIDKPDSLISRVMILKATEGNNSEHWRHFLNWNLDFMTSPVDLDLTYNSQSTGDATIWNCVYRSLVFWFVLFCYEILNYLSKYRNIFVCFSFAIKPLKTMSVPGRHSCTHQRCIFWWKT